MAATELLTSSPSKELLLGVGTVGLKTPRIHCIEVFAPHSEPNQRLAYMELPWSDHSCENTGYALGMQARSAAAWIHLGHTVHHEQQCHVKKSETNHHWPPIIVSAQNQCGTGWTTYGCTEGEGAAQPCCMERGFPLLEFCSNIPFCNCNHMEP